MIRVRLKQSRAQRRALACVLLMQRAYLAAHGAKRREVNEYMRLVAIAADKIDAMTVFRVVRSETEAALLRAAGRRSWRLN